jgi:hypothetical protein
MPRDCFTMEAKAGNVSVFAPKHSTEGSVPLPVFALHTFHFITSLLLPFGLATAAKSEFLGSGFRNGSSKIVRLLHGTPSPPCRRAPRRALALPRSEERDLSPGQQGSLSKPPLSYPVTPLTSRNVLCSMECSPPTRRLAAQFLSLLGGFSI